MQVDPEVVARVQEQTRRFWTCVEKRGPEECWPWRGTTNPKGYGTFRFAGRSRSAHVLSWELHHGETIAPGMMGCHSCDHPWCVNPAHIWPGTARDNAKDAVAKGRLRTPTQTMTAPIRNQNSGKTHCKRGHELTGDNVIPRGKWRPCRECQRMHQKAWKAKQKANGGGSSHVE